uniref:Protein kinase C-binding protein 1 n=1 Tax=Plectus sambesii TaxID=2011161 RepID=A0A914W7Q9_9BILA
MRARHPRRSVTSKEKKENGEAVDGVQEGKTEDDLDDSATASHYIGKTGGGVKRKDVITIHNTPKKRRKAASGADSSDNDLQDVYCWECHKQCVDDGGSRTVMDCSQCPRTFHPQCLSSPSTPPSDDRWICPVCLRLNEAEADGRKAFPLMSFTDDDLCAVLSHAWKRMRHVDSEPFQHPVPQALVPDYYDVIFRPMDLSTMEKKIRNGAYTTTDAFLEDAKWISHNSFIYNGASSKYTNDAKQIIKLCKFEMEELELCPDCYRYSTLMPTPAWFTNPCTKPHCLVWAKLKGFPYWPAKALRVNAQQQQVDVRFFGEHDRAWLPVKDCYLASEDAPLSPKSIKKRGLEAAVDEMREHIVKLRAKFGNFRYAAPKTEFKPEHLSDCPILFGSDNGGGAGNVSQTREKDGSNSNNEEEEEEGEEEDGEDEEESMEKESSRTRAPAGGINGVFELDENLGKQLSDEGSRLSDNAGRTSTVGIVKNILPSEEGLGILQRLQNTLNCADGREESPSPKASANNHTTTVHSNGTLPNEASTSAAAVAGESTSKSVETPASHPQQQGKRKLDQVLQRMSNVNRTNATNNSTNNNNSSSSSPATSTIANSSPAARSFKATASNSHAAPRVQTAASTASSPALSTNRNRLSAPVASIPTGVQQPNVEQAVAAAFQKHADKLCGVLKTSFSEMMADVRILYSGHQPTASRSDSSNDATVASLRAELQRTKRLHETALVELRAVSKEAVADLRRSFEAEKRRLVVDLNAKHEIEKEALSEELKRKQWCANCGNEAVFYCCWNTSYCDYPCQQSHWPTHQATCTQVRQTQPPAATATASSTPTSVPSVTSSTVPFGSSAHVEEVNKSVEQSDID